MKIQLTNIGKRFGRSASGWIFRDINQIFELGKSYAITGGNGSGKSTLLKVISGGLSPTLGATEFDEDGKQLIWSDVAPMISFAAPYMELIEYLTLQEHVLFHFRFKKYVHGMNEDRVIDAIEMSDHKNKLVKDFSSGMKQRLKLALTIYTDNPIILLDEPTSNLDEKWSNWYLSEIKKVKDQRLLVIASNQLMEYDFCDKVIAVDNMG